MLFADPAVQAFVRDNFIAAWDSVRPVPIVTIDFGNGHVLERTLNGNVATYVCDAQGRVVDVIPGLCDPALYVRQLTEALALHERSLVDPGAVAAWHAARLPPSLAAAEKARVAPREERMLAVPTRRLDISKLAVELPLKRVLQRDEETLAEDGRLNLVWRRPIVHELLTYGTHVPATMTHTIYREALHVDLDDPVLGLGGGPFGGGAYGIGSHDVAHDGFELDELRRAAGLLR